MKHQFTIIQTNEILKERPHILAALLIGSWGRQEAKPNSDIDYQIWVDNDFNPNALCEVLRDGLEGCIYAYYVEYKQMLVCYFDGLPKLEIAFFWEKEHLARLFLGSEIHQVAQSLVVDHTGEVTDYLSRMLSEKQAKADALDIQERRSIVERFIYEFEKASASHKRSDSYRSYFYYNTALHCAIQLHYYASGQYKYAFLPPNFAVIYEEDMNAFKNVYRRLAGSLHLAELNDKKRQLLDYFYEAIDKLAIYELAERQSIETLLESFYRRDYLWNFRDASTLQPKLKRGKVFRASSLTRYQDEPFFASFLQGWGISKVVDLRDEDELAKSPYKPQTLSLFQHIHLPIDPRKQSEEFISKYHYGTNHQIAYRHFAKEHKACFKQLLEEIDPAKDVFLIHCHAGKDRTGAVVALLSLLAGSSWQEVINDYEASEMDARLEKLEAFFEVVEEYGGVEPYLNACGIAQQTITHWKKHLSHA